MVSRSDFAARVTRVRGLIQSGGRTPYTQDSPNARRNVPPARMTSTSHRPETKKQRLDAADGDDGDSNTFRAFVGVLETARQQVEEDMIVSVEETEAELKERLDDITDVFVERAAKFQAECEKTFVHIPVSGESPGKFDPANKFGIDRDRFVDVVDARNKSLELLWAEWEKVQQNIACLAIEVFGPDAAGISMDPGNKVMRKKMARATALHRKQRSEQEAMLQELQKLGVEISSMTANTVKQLKARQKRCIEQRKKQRAEVCQLAKKMMAHV